MRFIFLIDMVNDKILVQKLMFHYKKSVSKNLKLINSKIFLIQLIKTSFIKNQKTVLFSN